MNNNELTEIFISALMVRFWRVISAPALKGLMNVWLYVNINLSDTERGGWQIWWGADSSRIQRQPGDVYRRSAPPGGTLTRPPGVWWSGRVPTPQGGGYHPRGGGNNPWGCYDAVIWPRGTTVHPDVHHANLLPIARLRPPSASQRFTVKSQH